MKNKELKFLLKLLSKENYCVSISQIIFSESGNKIGSAERNKICRQLYERKLVDCTEKITKIRLTPTGKDLLKLDNLPYPLSRQEQQILKACQPGAIAISKINVKPAKTRDELIQKLLEKGFIEAASTEIKEVSLSGKGKEFLANEYLPTGEGNLTLSKQMLNDYLSFIRKYSSVGITGSTEHNNRPKPNDDEILQIIIKLDKELGTENYLPIFYLREKLQPPLSREELDQALYRLQKQDKLELSSLVEAIHYTPEQMRAGIPLDIGGYLFYLIVN